MSRRVRLAALVSLALRAVLVLLAGCPDDDEADGAASDGGASLPGAGGAHADLDVCDADLAWVERCQGEPDFGYDPEWGQTECPMLPWRYIQPAFIDASAECFETLACTEYDDVCTGAGFMALGVDDETDLADDALFQRCVELADGCADALSEDVCSTLIAFTSAGRDAAADCLDLACDQVEACLHNPD